MKGARRILPALVAVTLVTMVAGTWIMLPGELAQLGRTAVHLSVFASNFELARAINYFSPDAELAPLLHTWSLSVEEQFYIVFPLLLLLLSRRLGRPGLFWGIAGLSLASLALAEIAVLPKPRLTFYLLPFRAWELGVGAMVALAPAPDRLGRFPRELLSVAGLMGLLYDFKTVFPGLSALPTVLGAGMLIYAGDRPGHVQRWLSAPLLVGLGLISYSLYLWHWPVMAFTRMGLGRTDLPFEVAVGTLAVSGLLGWASWRWIERPFRLAPGQRRRPRAVAMGSVSALLLILAAGGALIHTDGLGGRMPPDIQRIAAAEDDWNPDRNRCMHSAGPHTACAVEGGPAPTPPDYLLWGDSHAQALRDAVAASASDRKGVFMGAPGCRPLRHLKRIPRDKGCMQMTEDVLAWIENTPSLKTIIIGTRWQTAVEGVTFGHERYDEVAFLPSSDGPISPGTNGPELVQLGLEATLDRLEALGLDVVLLGPIPEPGWSVPRVAARHALLGLQLPPLFDRDLVMGRVERSTALLAELAARHDNVRLIDLWPGFCDPVTCRIVDAEGIPLYSDDDHLTRTAAVQRISPLLSGAW